MSIIASRCRCAKDTDFYHAPSFVQRHSKTNQSESEVILETTTLHGDDNAGGKGGGDFKHLTKLNLQKDGISRLGNGNFINKNPKELKQDRPNVAPFTSQGKETMVTELRTPWLKGKSQKQISSKELQNGEKKQKTTGRNRQGKKKGLNAKATDRDENEFKEFMAKATVKDLQRYFRNISSRTSSQPCNFSTDTFLRAAKIQVDHERVKQLRSENLTMVFKINQIMRSKGKVDHIHENMYFSSKLDAMISKIKKIEKNNRQMYKRIQKTNGALPTARQLEADWKMTINKMRAKAKYPLTIPGLVNLEEINEDEPNRPRVFLEFGIENGNILGTIVLSLYLDVMPITVTNFVALCEKKQLVKGKINENSENDTPHLAGSPIHRIFPDLYFEGGDILTGNGGTGMAARGVDFYPEHMETPHDHEGTISMSVTPGGRINSLFAISFRPLELLKGRRPAFGRVVKGLKLLETIKSYGTRNGKPKQKILITRCGLIYPK